MKRGKETGINRIHTAKSKKNDKKISIITASLILALIIFIIFIAQLTGLAFDLGNYFSGSKSNETSNYSDPMQIRGLLVTQSALNATIDWFTISLTNFTLYYGNSTVNMGNKIENSNFTSYHEAVLHNLSENVVYYYRIYYCNQQDYCLSSPIYSFIRYEVWENDSDCEIQDTRIVTRKNILINCDINCNGTLIFNSSVVYFDRPISRVNINGYLYAYSSSFYANQFQNEDISLESRGQFLANNSRFYNASFNFYNGSVNSIYGSYFALKNRKNFNFFENSISYITNTNIPYIEIYYPRIVFNNSAISETNIHSTKGLAVNGLSYVRITRDFFFENLALNLINSALGKIVIYAESPNNNIIINSTLYGLILRENSNNTIINSSVYNDNNSIIFNSSKNYFINSRCLIFNQNFSSIIENSEINSGFPGSTLCRISQRGFNKILGYIYIPGIIDWQGQLERAYPVKVFFKKNPAENITVLIKKDNEIIDSSITDIQGIAMPKILFNSSYLENYSVVINEREYAKINLLTNTLNPITINKDDYPVVYQISPYNNYSTRERNITFICNATDDIGLRYLDLYINVPMNNSNVTWQLARRVNCPGNSLECYLNYSRIMAPGSYSWTCMAYDSAYQKSKNESFILNIINSPPNVTLNEPADNFITNSTTILFNCSAEDDRQVSSLSLHTNISGWRQEILIPCNSKKCALTYERNVSLGTYQWNCLAYDNDGLSAWNPKHFIFQVINFTTPIVDFIPPTPENGSIVNITDIEIKVTSNEPLVEAVLDINQRNITMNESKIWISNVWTAEINDLENKEYEYKAWGENLLGLINSTETRTFLVNTTNQTGNETKENETGNETTPTGGGSTGGGGGGGGGTTTLNVACNQGEQRCLGNSLQECQGNWITIKQCSSCDPARLICTVPSSAEQCTAGTRCNENVLQKCVSGSWTAVQECAYGCDSSSLSCFDCKEGSFCKEDMLYTCVNGKLQGKACNCVDSKCQESLLDNLWIPAVIIIGFIVVVIIIFLIKRYRYRYRY